ncbi:hypothetical protein BHK98_03905 [Hornefia porci]|uniref:Uncharacterized protein n=1 Tax=Hornefia porci TaxID=2652292 RepID=A0A1Q9JGN4_9FIRM|nr:hypothetical protein [Hornefia porci]OLR55284.1 hypothetical protein BHK98_03905 [Hornefia porci]
MGTLFDAAKAAARIRNDRHDDEIKSYIAAAREELRRVGVEYDALSSIKFDAEMQTDNTNFTAFAAPLVQQAIITYCLWHLTEEADLIDRYESAFRMQADALRRRFPEGG